MERVERLLVVVGDGEADGQLPDGVEAAVRHAETEGRVGSTLIGGPGSDSEHEIDARWELAADAYPSPHSLTAMIGALAGTSVVAARDLPIDAVADGGGPGSVLRSPPTATEPPSGVTTAAVFRRGFGLGAEGDVRALGLSDRVGETGTEPFATVVVRSRGDRLHSLEEALTCLAGQRDSDFEVLLTLHDPTGEATSSVEALLDAFAPAFRTRVELVPVAGGGRARPLNLAIERGRGEYLAFLDDDDVVAADWIEAFARAAREEPGAIVRSGSLARPIRRNGHEAGYEPTGPAEPRFGGPAFDLVDHLVDNRSPIFSFAVPLTFVRDHDVRFDEDLDVLEDWDFLMRCALELPVAETGLVTGVYHQWQGGEASLDEVGSDAWAEARRRVHEKLDALVTPRGAASRLAELERRLAQEARSNEELRVRLEHREPGPSLGRPAVRRLLRRIQRRHRG